MIPVTRIYLLYLQTVLIRAGPILGDPGAVSGGRESLNRREKNSRKEKSTGLFFSFLTFLCANFFLACLDFLCPH